MTTDLSPSGIQRLLEICDKADASDGVSIADFAMVARTAFPDALRELSASRERIAALTAAIRWALGEGDSDFGDNKPTNLGPFWWRIELSRRARLSGGVGE